MTEQKRDKLAAAFDEISRRHLDEALRIRNGEEEPETAGVFKIRYVDRAVAILCIAALLLAATVQLAKNLSGNNFGDSGSEETPIISKVESKDETGTEHTSEYNRTTGAVNTTEGEAITGGEAATEDTGTAEEDNYTAAEPSTENASDAWIEDAWNLFYDLDAEKAPKTSIWAYTGFVDSMDTYGAFCPAADCDGDGTIDRVYVYAGNAYLFFGNKEILYLGDVSENDVLRVKYADITRNGVNEIILIRHQLTADSGDEEDLDIFERKGTLWEKMEYPWMEMRCELDGDKIIYTQPYTDFRAETDSELLVGDEIFSADLAQITGAGRAVSIRIDEKNGEAGLYISATIGNRWYFTTVYWCLTYDEEWKITNIFMPDAKVLANGGVLADGFEVYCPENDNPYMAMPEVYECINSFAERYQGSIIGITYEEILGEMREEVLLSVRALVDGEMRQFSCRLKGDGVQYEIDQWSEGVSFKTEPF